MWDLLGPGIEPLSSAFAGRFFFLEKLLKKNNFIYLVLAVLGLYCHEGFSVVVATRGYSVAVVHELLLATASLVPEHGL